MTDSIVTVEPSEEPVTVADLVEHAILDADVATAYTGWLTRNLKAARKSAESICRIALVTQTRKFALDEFPRPGMNIGSANWYGPQWGVQPGPLSVLLPDGTTGYELLIPYPPLQSISAITYYDQDGAQQTLSPSLYLVDTYSKPGRVLPAPNATWPGTQKRVNAVEVTFVCGYGAATVVPEGIKNWILMRAAAAFENREEIQVGQRLAAVDLPFVDALLQEFRVVRF